MVWFVLDRRRHFIQLGWLIHRYIVLFYVYVVVVVIQVKTLSHDSATGPGKKLSHIWFVSWTVQLMSWSVQLMSWTMVQLTNQIFLSWTVDSFDSTLAVRKWIARAPGGCEFSLIFDFFQIEDVPGAWFDLTWLDLTHSTHLYEVCGSKKKEEGGREKKWI